MFTLLVILLALAFDILVYLTAGSFLAVESFGIFVIIIYLIPALLNGVIVATGVMENIKFRFLKYILPTLTLFAYFVFGKMVVYSSEWQKFVENNTYTNGSFSIQVSKDLLGLEQILFILIFNFVVVIAVKKIVVRSNQRVD
ncbi:Msa family membrane protein [Fructilactobacillus frigidiflavus]|uniref:Msa family membrane protein n=1 Tax=Fructilactobacillus frigidiflavus TaxID=3242688 RepID=UPI0037568A07